MATISQYETVVIFKSNLGKEAITALLEKFKALVSENGTIESVDEWGKRRLAYPINDENEGIYVQFVFSADNSFPTELDRQLKLTDGVMRSLIIRK
ncbi:MAG TPA: 30S ribosomal protein S6 [Ruminococcaceae bacterium]|nr:30S ribosomal protein S6 [Oscillospiraceae bacterium]